MNEEAHNQVLNLIKDAQRILITSHISPDPDAVCSTLLFANTIKANFPDKNIVACLEEKPAKDISFLPGYEAIEFRTIHEILDEMKPDLFVLLDGPNFDRLSRDNGANVRQYVKDNNVKTIIIDHHEQDDRDNADLYINNKNPATVQDIYDLFFNELKLDKPDGYGETTMLGILTDTRRFKYANSNHRLTFQIVSDLIDAGVSIEKLENDMNRYQIDQMKVFGILAKNVIDEQNGYTYSFVTDDFAKDWKASQKSIADFKNGCELFTDQFIRNIDDNRWGFTVCPELDQDEGWYSVSLRSIDGAKDVSQIARELGGGGHKPAAGAKFQASSIEDAIDKVKRVISGSSI